MPSTVRIDHSIRGPELDALRAGATTATGPTSRPARGVNAWAFVDGKLWPAVLALALLVVAVAVVGAWRSSRAPAAPVAAYAPPAVAAPVATVAVPALAPAPTVDVVAMYAALPTITVYCDNVRHDYPNARAVGRMLATTPDWQRRCVAAYGWCEACQQAWQDAHP